MPSITQNTWNEWNVLSSSIRQGYVTTGELDDIITTLNGGEYNPAQLSEVLEQLPEMVEVKNLKYETTEVMYKSKTLFNGEDIRTGIPEPNHTISSQINSNVGQGVATKTKTVQTNRVLNMSKDATTGKATISDELFKYRGGSPTPTRAKMVAANIASGVVAAGVGISAGKTVASTLYNLNPDFFNSHNMETLNPYFWSSLTSDGDTVVDSLINVLVGIDENTGNPQLYANQDMVAYLMSYMANEGVFDNGSGITVFDPDLSHYQPFSFSSFPYGSGSEFITNAPNRYGYIEGDGPFYAIRQPTDEQGYSFVWVCSPNIFRCSTSGGSSEAHDANHAEYREGYPFYLMNYQFKMDLNSACAYLALTPENTSPQLCCSDIIVNSTFTPSTTPEGISNQESEKPFDTSSLTDYTDIDATRQALQNQYPEWWDNRVEFSPDGETTMVYIPIAFPTGGTTAQPTTEGATQAQPAPQIDQKGDNATEEAVKSLIDMLTKNSPALNPDVDTPASIGGASPNEFNTGTGSTPAIVTPTGSASALWKIYNPSQSELDTFGAWLWSPNFVDQLLKVFNDPMQAIIGLHKIFCTPSVSGSGVIKVGYLSSNATANYVDDQYVDVDCGSVDLYEFYGNVFDYEPFTRLQLFLPFIGFVGLSTSDCTRGKIKVKYRVDVLTGQCLATVSVVRDMHENILYTYAGNCAVQYPVSSGSYVGIIGGLLGIAGTIASGGALAPVAIGAMAGIGGIHTDVKHSGSIQGSAGAMGCKTPYLVIERPQTAMPNNGELIEGLPQNETVTLGSCSGFVKVKKATYNISALDVELDMIKSLLENGVYI